ncbi:uncharacterized protein LOC123553814 [Mercenaria mercenaria]|uniref:uncharacterized protein LOC123553814 n=1 Tax=Mercenaria mercenaria TaxID=6596 RepID=UPI00234E7CB8|nr:uncharacterized protein LOC123553814 [Mercenaria mercenaria]
MDGHCPTMKPSQIRYSAVSEKDMDDNGILIGQELDDLIKNRKNIGAIPPLPIAQHNHYWVTPNNRRLWICRQLQRLEMLNMIRVRKVGFIPTGVFDDLTIIDVGRQQSNRKQKSSLILGLVAGIVCAVVIVLAYFLNK